MSKIKEHFHDEIESGMKNAIKEVIEENLLAAMRGIDVAVFNICEKLGGGMGAEVDELSRCKNEIKKILNKHFDRLAREHSNK